MELADRTVEQLTAPLGDADPAVDPALRLFMDGLRSLNGILGHQRFGRLGIRGSVADRLSETGQRVYDLEEEVRRQYPDTDLDVWVSEVA